MKRCVFAKFERCCVSLVALNRRGPGFRDLQSYAPWLEEREETERRNTSSQSFGIYIVRRGLTRCSAAQTIATFAPPAGGSGRPPVLEAWTVGLGTWRSAPVPTLHVPRCCQRRHAATLHRIVAPPRSSVSRTGINQFCDHGQQVSCASEAKRSDTCRQSSQTRMLN